MMMTVCACHTDCGWTRGGRVVLRASRNRRLAIWQSPNATATSNRACYPAAGTLGIAKGQARLRLKHEDVASNMAVLREVQGLEKTGGGENKTAFWRHNTTLAAPVITTDAIFDISACGHAQNRSWTNDVDDLSRISAPRSSPPLGRSVNQAQWRMGRMAANQACGVADARLLRSAHTCLMNDHVRRHRLS